uniref:Uncharacterized protein n=1 Tax=Aegilops tauschii subsp. strangulata TaxID=200361 RepID=A0A453PBK7_AEGTS
VLFLNDCMFVLCYACSPLQVARTTREYYITTTKTNMVANLCSGNTAATTCRLLYILESLNLPLHIYIPS